MSSGNDGGARLTVSADDHRAIIVIVVVICALWSLMVIGARMIWRFHQKSDSGLDDVVALLGTFISFAQAGVTLQAVHYGYGKKEDLLDSSQIADAGRYLYAGNILYVLGSCASKAAMPLLIARLTRDRRQLYITYILLAITLVWGFASTFAIAFACGLPVPLTTEAQGTCSGLFAAWTAIESIGLLIEVLIIGLAIALVENLNMLFKFKFAVVLSFSLRIFLTIPVAFRLDLLRRLGSSTDPFFSNVNVGIATQIILHYSLWAASFPCMRAFLRAFDTGLGVTTGVPTHKGSNYQNDSKGGSFAMQSIDRRQSNTARTPRHSQIDPLESPDMIEKVMTDNTVEQGVRGQRQDRKQHNHHHHHHKEQLRTSDEESESSRKAIITRTVEWKINYEDAPGTAL